MFWSLLEEPGVVLHLILVTLFQEKGYGCAT